MARRWRIRHKLMLALVTVFAVMALLLAGACDRIPGAGGGATPPAVSAAALKTAAEDPAVKAFYEKRGWKAAWSEASAEALVQALQVAPRHGLNVSRFADLVEILVLPVVQVHHLRLARRQLVHRRPEPFTQLARGDIGVRVVRHGLVAHVHARALEDEADGQPYAQLPQLLQQALPALEVGVAGKGLRPLARQALPQRDLLLPFARRC